MKAFGKATSSMLISVAVLAACGNGEEDATGSESETNEGVTDVQTDNDESEEVEDESEKDEGDTNEDGDEKSSDEEEAVNENEAEGDDEDSAEKVYEPVGEGEEQEAATTKEDNYLQAGMVTGGEITDGKSVANIEHGIHDEYERLVLDIYEGSYQELESPAVIPNHFEVTKEAYPSRFVYTLRGIRGQPDEIPDLSNMDLFSYMDTLPLFDDATILLAAYLQEPIEFEIFEMHDPAKIVTDVSLLEQEAEYASVYSVRTASISEDENIELIQRPSSAFEEQGADQVRTLHSEDNTIFVEEGYYSTLEEAEERKEELENDGIDIELHIEERGMVDMPENIEGNVDW